MFIYYLLCKKLHAATARSASTSAKKGDYKERMSERKRMKPLTPIWTTDVIIRGKKQREKITKRKKEIEWGSPTIPRLLTGGSHSGWKPPG